jgi:hypothetical protein
MEANTSKNRAEDEKSGEGEQPASQGDHCSYVRTRESGKAPCKMKLRLAVLQDSAHEVRHLWLSRQRRQH